MHRAEMRKGLTCDPAPSILLRLSSSISPAVCLPGMQSSIPPWESKPPRQTAALISLIINQYAAGSPSGEEFTQCWHLFSGKTGRDGGDGGRRTQGHLRLLPRVKGTDGGKEVVGGGFEKFVFFFSDT